MNHIASMSESQAALYYQSTQSGRSSKTENGKTRSDIYSKADHTDSTSTYSRSNNTVDNDATMKQATKFNENKINAVSGPVIGNVTLSDKAAKYYEELKKKFHNLDFVLVSEEEKANAQANIGQYANASKMVVLIDTDKIERMANDENYRKQYEGIISNAGNQLSQLSSNISMQNANVKTYGMKFDDGGNASFFAVIDGLYKDQDKRIKAKAAQKKESQKLEKKKTEEKQTKIKAEKKIQEQKKLHSHNNIQGQDKIQENSKTSHNTSQTVTITASSVEELLQKIDQYTYGHMSDSVESKQEKQIGQHIDFKG